MAIKDVSLNQSPLLGKGFAFPFAFSPKNGSVDAQSGVTVQQALDKIKTSIFQIIYTGIGERFFNRTYGSLARSAVFEPSDNFLLQQLTKNVTSAVNKWEPRVTLNTIKIDTVSRSHGIVQINMTLLINEINVQVSLILPFSFQGNLPGDNISF